MRGVEHIPWLYDSLAWGLDLLGLSRWRRDLVQGARGRVLEVGCGTGRNLPLYPAGTQVIGLDLDPALLARAQRRAPGVPLLAGSVEALPFADGCFDTVISSLVFCSVADPLAGLAEIRRVLRPGGQLRMLEHVRSHRPIWANLQDHVQPLWTCVTGGCHPNRETENVVERSGFAIDPGSRRTRRVLRFFTARP